MSKNTSKKETASSRTIALNKKAKFDYFFEEKFEAGIALEGWELKAIRAGKVQLVDSYILLKNGEASLIGALISPLTTASTHITTDAQRTRKLLLHRRELDKIIGLKERAGYTVVPVAMYWKGRRVKLEIAVAKGKKSHDKRATIKDREWKREKERAMKITR